MTTDPYEVRDQFRKNRITQDVLDEKRQKFREHLHARLHQSIHSIYQADPFRTAVFGSDVRVKAGGEWLFSVRVNPSATKLSDPEKCFQFMQNSPGITWESVCSGLFTLDYILQKAAGVAGLWLFTQERINARTNDS